MDEILDLVNEKDEVIGQVSRSEANSNPNIYHRDVAIVIYDNDKKVLLQKRNMTKKLLPGYWIVSVAGHIGKGMDPETVAHRELVEELGFDTKLEYAGKMLTVLSNEKNFTYCYYAKYENQKIIPQASEISEYRFFSPEDVETLINSGEKYQQESIDWVKRFWKEKH
ncbi:MAG: NUDIX domain-containing protein [Candidatus Shapirobacteria bacterium]